MKLNYIVGMAALLWGAACEPSRDYEQWVSGTDDYTQSSGVEFEDDKGRDMSQWDKAVLFPGVVDTLTEKRLDEITLEIDLDKKYVSPESVLFINMPPAIYSTGLWAGAGERVVVEMDQDIKGLSVQIGVHQDLTVLSNSGSYIGRSPKVVNTQSIFQGITEVSNPWGGYIWIRRAGTDGHGKLKLKIRNVYKAPDFILGETGQLSSDWIDQVNQTTVPYVELRGKHVAFTVATQYLKAKVNNADFVPTLEQALTEYDKWLESIWVFYGMDGTDSSWPMPDFPSRVVMDVHLANERTSCFGSGKKYVANSDAIEVVQSEEMFELLTRPEYVIQALSQSANVLGWWQLYYQPVNINNSYLYNTVEKFWSVYLLMPTLNYLKQNHWERQNYRLTSYYRSGDYNVVGISTGDQSVVVKDDEMNKKIDWIKVDSVKTWTDTRQTTLCFLTQLMAYQSPDNASKNGLSFFGSLYREYVNSKQTTSFMNRLLTSLGEYFQRDFTVMFDQYGIAFNDESRISAMKYKPIEKELWTYNVYRENENTLPDYDGRYPYTPSGKAPFHHNRNKWQASAYGKGEGLKIENEDGDEEKEVLIDGIWTKRNYFSSSYVPSKLLDGDVNSYWHSYADPWYTHNDKDGNKVYAYKKDSLFYKAKTPDFDYYVVIGMDQPLEKVNGFYWVNGKQAFDKYLLFEESYKKGLRFSYAPQHVIVEFTENELMWNEDEEAYEGVVGDNTAVHWTKVYDSDGDSRFNPDARNRYYIDLPHAYQKVCGIRLTFDRDSHKAKDKPSWWDEEKYPNRPDKANTYLNRIQQFAEFGTYYYNK